MTDYISREDAAKYAENIRQHLNELYNDGWLEISDVDWRVLMEIILSVGDIPAADVKPVVNGEWGRVIALHGEKYWCSECKGVTGKRSNFCPNCGADMRKEKNE